MHAESFPVDDLVYSSDFSDGTLTCSGSPTAARFR